jgi:hypothetical protein
LPEGVKESCVCPIRSRDGERARQHLNVGARFPQSVSYRASRVNSIADELLKEAEGEFDKANEILKRFKGGLVVIGEIPDAAVRKAAKISGFENTERLHPLIVKCSYSRVSSISR